MKLRAFPMAAALPLLLASAIQAGTMLQPVGATTDMGSFSAQYPPTRVIDQTGLSATYVSGVTDFDTFASSTNTVGGGGGSNTWYSAQGDLTGNFDFDLGALYELESFALWADPQPTTNQGVNGFNLYADDNAGFTSPTLLGSYSALGGLGDANNFGQIFPFAPTTASHVRMEVLSNHGSTLVTGMVEAAFEVVPEPGSFALVLAAGLASTLRRRR